MNREMALLSKSLVGQVTVPAKCERKLKEVAVGLRANVIGRQ